MSFYRHSREQPLTLGFPAGYGVMKTSHSLQTLAIVKKLHPQQYAWVVDEITGLAKEV
jgi:hypothetical protein